MRSGNIIFAHPLMIEMLPSIHVLIYRARTEWEQVQCFVFENETNLNACYRKNRQAEELIEKKEREKFHNFAYIFCFVWLLSWHECVCMRGWMRECAEREVGCVKRILCWCWNWSPLLSVHMDHICELIIRSNSIEYKRVMKILCKRLRWRWWGGGGEERKIDLWKWRRILRYLVSTCVRWLLCMWKNQHISEIYSNFIHKFRF